MSRKGKRRGPTPNHSPRSGRKQGPQASKGGPRKNHTDLSKVKLMRGWR